MKFVSIVIFISLVSLTSIFGQSREEKTARELGGFETEWLTAVLNNEREWLTRFLEGRINLQPAGDTAGDRQRFVVDTLDPTLSPNEMKVRITGTISLLTNDPARNRSFYFLDTFNKRGDKWQVIASHFSQNKNEPPSPGFRTTIDELVKLENELARSGVVNDRSAIERLLAADFVGTSPNGKIRNRQEWLAAEEYEGVKRTASREVHVHIYSDTLAVVTGIDTTVRLDKDGREIVHQGRFTDTWLKRNGQWQVIAAHVARIK
jgi:hypothetical protein